MNINGEVKLAFPRSKIDKEIKSAKDFKKEVDKLTRLLKKEGITFTNKPQKQTVMVHQANINTREIEQIFIFSAKMASFKRLSNKYCWIKRDAALTNKQIPWWDKKIIEDWLGLLS